MLLWRLSRSSALLLCASLAARAASGQQLAEAQCISPDEAGGVTIRVRTTPGRSAFFTRTCAPLTCTFGQTLTADGDGWATFPSTLAGNAKAAKQARVGDGSATTAWSACGPRPAVQTPPPQGVPPHNPPVQVTPPVVRPPHPTPPVIGAQVLLFGRPSAQDSRPERPSRLLVPEGSQITLHWQTTGADLVQLLSRGTDARDRPLPGPPLAAAGSLAVRVAGDTSYGLRLRAHGQTTDHPRLLRVTTYQTHGVPAHLTLIASNGGMDLVPVTAPPSHSASRTAPTIAPIFPARAPDLLQFGLEFVDVPGGRDILTMNHLDVEARRKKAVEALYELNGFGRTSKPRPDLRNVTPRGKAYLDAIFAGEKDATVGGYLLDQTDCGASSCGVLVRNLWHLMGVRDPTLSPPYAAGKVFTLLRAVAASHGALHAANDADFIASFDPKPGDVLYIAGHGAQHMITVVERHGGDLYTVDGGQIAPTHNTFKYAGLPSIDDGGCMGIRRRIHRFSIRGKTVHIDKDNKDVAWWVDFAKLKFDGPIIMPWKTDKAIRDLPDWDFDDNPDSKEVQQVSVRAREPGPVSITKIP